MPITTSAKKALRQSHRRHARNLIKKEAYKRAVRKIKKSVAKNDLTKTEELIRALYAAVDKAAKTHVIKKNKASRLKSRLTKRITKAKK